jgi:hypothetical protein
VVPRAVLDAVVKRKIPNPLWISNPRTPTHPFSAKVNNAWSYTSTPPVRLNGVVLN